LFWKFVAFFVVFPLFFGSVFICNLKKVTDFLTIHGIIENGNVIGSSSWHEKEFGTTGGLVQKIQYWLINLRSPPLLGTRTCLTGKVVGFEKL
jgi:hypothetical protein